jgi:hypothetical protein
VSAILFFPPRTRLAVGKGEEAARRQKLWVKLVSVTMPTLILTGFLIPLFREYIKTWF